MTVEVSVLDPETEDDRWDWLVERAHRTHPLYRSGALSLQATETGTTYHLLVGHVGEEPVGVFPVFEYRRGPLAAAFSPPPRSWSCFLGPAMIEDSSLKRRTADRRTASFLEGCLEWIDETVSPLYSKYVLAMKDVRPFLSEFAAEVSYTYVVPLDADPDSLLERFSSDARRKIRSAPERATIEEGNGRDIERIIEQVQARYAAQDRAFHLKTDYARRLYEELGATALRPYVCRLDGTFVGGILVLESDSTRYRWLGGVKPAEGVDVPVNELLDWRVMVDGLDAGIERYDMVGAGVSSINRYKAKYNPELETYHTVTTGSYGLDTVIDRYRKPG